MFMTLWTEEEISSAESRQSFNDAHVSKHAKCFLQRSASRWSRREERRSETCVAGKCWVDVDDVVLIPQRAKHSNSYSVVRLELHFDSRDVEQLTFLQVQSSFLWWFNAVLLVR